LLAANASVAGAMVPSVNTPAAPYVDGHWHQVALTVDAGNTLRLYADGKLADSSVLAGATDAPSRSLYIGHWGGGNGSWSGQIDDVRYSSVARSAAEIAGSFETRQPHGRPIGDSDPSDTGVAIAACTNGARCADVVYGATGTSNSLTGGRYWVESKVRAGAGQWSAWMNDWFEMTTGKPINQYADDANAATGIANRTGIISPTPHLSWINTAGANVDHDHTQVVTDPLDNVDALWHFDGNQNDASGNGISAPLDATYTPTYQSASLVASSFGQTMQFHAEPARILGLRHAFEPRHVYG